MKALYTRITRVMRRLPFGIKAESIDLPNTGEYVFIKVESGHDVTVSGDVDSGWLITINEVA